MAYVLATRKPYRIIYNRLVYVLARYKLNYYKLSSIHILAKYEFKIFNILNL